MTFGHKNNKNFKKFEQRPLLRTHGQPAAGGHDSSSPRPAGDFSRAGQNKNINSNFRTTDSRNFKFIASTARKPILRRGARDFAADRPSVPQNAKRSYGPAAAARFAPLAFDDKRAQRSDNFNTKHTSPLTAGSNLRHRRFFGPQQFSAKSNNANGAASAGASRSTQNAPFFPKRRRGGNKENRKIRRMQERTERNAQLLALPGGGFEYFRVHAGRLTLDQLRELERSSPGGFNLMFGTRNQGKRESFFRPSGGLFEAIRQRAAERRKREAAGEPAKKKNYLWFKGVLAKRRKLYYHRERTAGAKRDRLTD